MERNNNFDDIYYELRKIGIENDEFFLETINNDVRSLQNLKLPPAKLYNDIIEECKNNFWFFLREIVDIPIGSESITSYKLSRAHLAANFLMINGCNIVMDGFRMSGKRLSVAVYYVWKILCGKTHFSVYANTLNDARLFCKIVEDILNLLPNFIQATMIAHNTCYIKESDNYYIVQNKAIGRNAAYIQIMTPKSMLNSIDSLDPDKMLKHDILYIMDFAYITANDKLFKFIDKYVYDNTQIIMESIAADTVSNPTAKNAYDFIKSDKIVSWNDKLYDINIDLNKFKAIFRVRFDDKTIERDIDSLLHQLKMIFTLKEDTTKIKNEIFGIWTTEESW